MNKIFLTILIVVAILVAHKKYAEYKESLPDYDIGEENTTFDDDYEDSEEETNDDMEEVLISDDDTNHSL